MRRPLLLSTALHGALVTGALVFGGIATAERSRPVSMTWSGSDPAPAVPDEQRERVLPVEEPPPPEPKLDDRAPAVDFTPFEEPVPEELAPVEPGPWPGDLLEKAGLDRVLPQREPERVTEATPPPPAKPRSVAKPEAAYVAPSPVETMNEPPRYPRLARRRGWQGEVLLRVLVAPDGTVERVEVAKSSGHEILDREAKRAVGRWTFAPATRGGKTIEDWLPLPVLFQLRG